MVPLALAASSLPTGMGVTRVPFVCQAPKPFLPCEIITAGKAAPDTTAVVLVPSRVRTAMLPSEQSANDVGAVGAGFGAHPGLCAAGVVVAHVTAAFESAKAGDTL